MVDLDSDQSPIDFVLLIAVAAGAASGIFVALWLQ